MLVHITQLPIDMIDERMTITDRDHGNNEQTQNQRIFNVSLNNNNIKKAIHKTKCIIQRAAVHNRYDREIIAKHWQRIRNAV